MPSRPARTGRSSRSTAAVDPSCSNEGRPASPAPPVNPRRVGDAGRMPTRTHAEDRRSPAAGEHRFRRVRAVESGLPAVLPSRQRLRRVVDPVVDLPILGAPSGRVPGQSGVARPRNAVRIHDGRRGRVPADRRSQLDREADADRRRARRARGAVGARARAGADPVRRSPRHWPMPRFRSRSRSPSAFPWCAAGIAATTSSSPAAAARARGARVPSCAYGICSPGPSGRACRPVSISSCSSWR